MWTLLALPPALVLTTLAGLLVHRRLRAQPTAGLLCALALAQLAALVAVALLPSSAPFEEPASPASTPSPSRGTPWFVALQEIVVYADPWAVTLGVPLLFASSALVLVGAGAELRLIRAGRAPSTPSCRTALLLLDVAVAADALAALALLVLLGAAALGGGPDTSFFGPYHYWDPPAAPGER